MYLIWKSLYVRPVHNDRQSTKLIRNHNRKTKPVHKHKSNNRSKSFENEENYKILITKALFKSQYFYGSSVKPYQTFQ